MSGFSIPLTRLVHENLSIIMCYAYSLKPLSDMMGKHFDGGWKYLNKGLFELSAQRAEKACMELALFLRTVDDDENITAYLDKTKSVTSCGRLVMESGDIEPLPFREVSNKIIHAQRLEWRMIIMDYGDSVGPAEAPVLYCYPRKHPTGFSAKKRWKQAEIDLVPLAAVCGMLAH